MAVRLSLGLVIGVPHRRKHNACVLNVFLDELHVLKDGWKFLDINAVWLKGTRTTFAASCTEYAISLADSMHDPVVVDREVILQPTENDRLGLLKSAEDLVRSLQSMRSKVP